MDLIRSKKTPIIGLAWLFILAGTAIPSACSEKVDQGGTGSELGTGGTEAGTGGSDPGTGGSEPGCIGPQCPQERPCATVYTAQCGKACVDTTECDPGLYCGPDQQCTADCVPGTIPCGAFSECSSDGRCTTPVDPDAGPSEDAGCIEVNVNFEPQIPTVVLLIDQSGSMDDSAGFSVPNTYEPWGCPDDDDWRWNVVRNVLFNPDTGVVRPLEGTVRFGLSLYTSLNGSLDGETCPTLEKVGIALNNYDAMLAEFVCSDIRRDTPTAPSLADAIVDLESITEPGPKIVILATDGEPDTCECPNFTGPVPEECREQGKQAEAREGVVAVAADAQSKDITVHVINVSSPNDDTLQTHLLDVAEAGGGNVYPGFSPDELKVAFQGIIDGARSCVFDLNGQVASGAESSGNITLNGRALPIDDPNGWTLRSSSQIEILGEACEELKTGDNDLSIKFPCGSFVVQ